MSTRHADEAVVLEQVGRIRDVLVRDYSSVASPGLVDQLVRAEYERFAGAPVRQFVPVFVGRSARSQLRQLGPLAGPERTLWYDS
jgi:hypothetical protein